jgi:hypothetical protein
VPNVSVLHLRRSVGFRAQVAAKPLGQGLEPVPVAPDLAADLAPVDRPGEVVPRIDALQGSVTVSTNQRRSPRRGNPAGSSQRAVRKLRRRPSARPRQPRWPCARPRHTHTAPGPGARGELGGFHHHQPTENGFECPVDRLSASSTASIAPLVPTTRCPRSVGWVTPRVSTNSSDGIRESPEYWPATARGHCTPRAVEEALLRLSTPSRIPARLVSAHLPPASRPW